MSWFNTLVSRFRSRKQKDPSKRPQDRRPSSAPNPNTAQSASPSPSRPADAEAGADAIYGVSSSDNSAHRSSIPKLNGSVFSPRPTVTARKHLNIPDRSPSPSVELEDDTFSPFSVPGLERQKTMKRPESKLRNQMGQDGEEEGWSAKRGPSLAAMRQASLQRLNGDTGPPQNKSVEDGDTRSAPAKERAASEGPADSGVDLTELQKKRGSRTLSHAMAFDRMKQFFDTTTTATSTTSPLTTDDSKKSSYRRHTLPTRLIFDENHNLIEVPVEGEADGNNADNTNNKINGEEAQKDILEAHPPNDADENDAASKSKPNGSLEKTEKNSDLDETQETETGDTMPKAERDANGELLSQSTTKRRRGSQSSIAFLS
ncbi:MAG: hypothetical protein Q9227_004377 [Pyrenula ochraceoflavens]